jgi:hypothetical protein
MGSTNRACSKLLTFFFVSTSDFTSQAFSLVSIQFTLQEKMTAPKVEPVLDRGLPILSMKKPVFTGHPNQKLRASPSMLNM